MCFWNGREAWNAGPTTAGEQCPRVRSNAVQGVPTEPGGEVNATDIDSLVWALAVAFVETNTTNEVLAATKTVFPLSGMR